MILDNKILECFSNRMRPEPTFHFTNMISVDTHYDVRIDMHIVLMRSKHKASDLLLMLLAVIDQTRIKTTHKA